jgi:hypothetical protein
VIPILTLIALWGLVAIVALLVLVAACLLVELRAIRNVIRECLEVVTRRSPPDLRTFHARS